jgi:putative transposase
MMKNELNKELALLRFSLIAPIVNNTYMNATKMDYYRETASKKYYLSNGKEIVFSPNTIKSWAYEYSHGGFDALFPKTRNDLGVSRSLSIDAIERIIEIKQQFPHITGTLVYEKLIEEGIIRKCDASLSSVLRYIKANNLKAKQLIGQERKAFEMEYANDMWQADTSHALTITISGKKYKTYLIMIIDDASRLIVGYGFFFNDNAVNMQIVLKQAIAKYGVPKRLFVDNGGAYRNDQLNMICASVQTVLIHSKPYTPQGKGKIERSFRTIKDKWMNGIDWNQFGSLESIHESFSQFLNTSYNNSNHSSLPDTTPKKRFIKDKEKIRYIEPEALEYHFLHREERRVMNDATIKIQTLSFEVPQRYIRQKIKVRYYPGDLSYAYIFDENEIIKIYPLNKIDNSKAKRNLVDYSKMNGGITHV